MTKKRVLIAGESWTVHSIHQKGFDSFTTTEYAEGVRWLKEALEAGGWDVTFQPSHVAARDFPFDAEALSAYDCVMLSDIGANTLLLHPETFSKSRVLPNRLVAIRDYVANGGGFVMIGGYLTFQGIEGKALYHETPIEEILPVTMMAGDDRAERPEGVVPEVRLGAHAIVNGLEAQWPALLGYNRVKPKAGVEIIATVGNDPLIVAGSYGMGRAVAFTSDCGPHWAPPPFVDWKGYNPLWQQLADWVAGERNG